MLYEDAVEDLKERFREMDEEYYYEKILKENKISLADKIINRINHRISHGGKVEKSMANKIGKKINKANVSAEKIYKFNPYEVVNKIHKKINKKYVINKEENII